MKLAQHQKKFYYELLFKVTATINSSLFKTIHDYRKRKELTTIYNSLSSIESFLLNRVEETVNAKFLYTDK